MKKIDPVVTEFLKPLQFTGINGEAHPGFYPRFIHKPVVDAKDVTYTGSTGAA